MYESYNTGPPLLINVLQQLLSCSAKDMGRMTPMPLDRCYVESRGTDVPFCKGSPRLLQITPKVLAPMDMEGFISFPLIQARFFE